MDVPNLLSFIRKNREAFFAKNPEWLKAASRNLLEKSLSGSESSGFFMYSAIFAVCTLFLYHAGAFDFEAENRPTTVTTETADTDKKAITPPDTPATPTYTLLTLQSGQTLIEALTSAGINRQNAHQSVNALAEHADMRKIRPGQEIRLKVSGGETSDSTLQIDEIRLRTAFDTEAVASRAGNGTAYSSEKVTIPTLPVSKYIEGTIDSSLYVAASDAGVPTKIIVDAIRLLSFDVDFEREIREGDRFRIYFDRRYTPEFDDIEEGTINRISLEMQKRTLNATLFTSTGNAEYFDDEGKSTKRALMKTPVDKAVVTSSYGRRRHPVLGYTRAHKGVDFRAPTGTPIMAAGDGIIERASRYGSYGHYIRIRHNGNYKTAYAHLSRYGRGIKSGARVRQGQIIGYSGATGRVTGAHLHYEVLYNGKQVNPMRLKLPSGRTLGGEELDIFKNQLGQIVAEIDSIKLVEVNAVPVAMLDIKAES